MANVLSRSTQGLTHYITIDADPRSGTGATAPIGSQAVFANASNGNVLSFFKYGVSDTQWQKDNVGRVLSVTYLKDIKDNNVNSGTSFVVYTKRTLNNITTVGNAFLAERQIVLNGDSTMLIPVGTWEIEGVFCQFNINDDPNSGKVKLYNVTSDTTEIEGMVGNFTKNNSGSGGHCHVKGLLSVTGVAKLFDFKHRVSTAELGVGLGFPCNFGDDEIYAQVKISEIASS